MKKITKKISENKAKKEENPFDLSWDYISRIRHLKDQVRELQSNFRHLRLVSIKK